MFQIIIFVFINGEFVVMQHIQGHGLGLTQR